MTVYAFAVAAALLSLCAPSVLLVLAFRATNLLVDDTTEEDEEDDCDEGEPVDDSSRESRLRVVHWDER